MKRQAVLYGSFIAALVFALLSWALPRKPVRAAALTASANGRFEILEEHGNNGTTQGVFLLDTETVCVEQQPTPKFAFNEAKW